MSTNVMTGFHLFKYSLISLLSIRTYKKYAYGTNKIVVYVACVNNNTPINSGMMFRSNLGVL